jgi:subtilisin-like proprotein convertase family protein/bacterioferritin-associated ferredoxin
LFNEYFKLKEKRFKVQFAAVQNFIDTCMKKIFTLFLGLILSLGVFSQTFNGSNGNLAGGWNMFPANVSGVGNISCMDITVCIDVSHNTDRDLDIYVQSPSGTNVMLTTDNGGNGNNYTNTCFNMTGINGNVTAGSAPFNGTYIPEGDLTTFDGENADGNWNLVIRDDAGATTGTVNSWSITFTPLGVPPTNVSPCTATEIAVATSCTMATYTNACAGDSGIGNPSCGNYQGDDVWFVFEVPSTGFVIIDFDANTITDGAMAVYSGDDCSSLTETGCYDDGDGFMPSTLTYSGLTPGDSLWVRFWAYGNLEQGDFDLCIWSDHTTISTCNDTFFDTGGAGGNYSADEMYAVTYCPSIPGRRIRATVNSFSVDYTSAAVYDEMLVYDGIGATGYIIGGYNDNYPIPGIITASPSSPNGCLTFLFNSDGGTNQSGWDIDITCADPCQTVNIGSYNTNPAYTSPGDGYDYVDACPGDVINFSATGSYPQNGANYAQSDATSTFTWYFGDGTIATGANVNHTYATGGAYDVGLVITDVNGCISYSDLPIRVRIPEAPTVTATPSTGCVGQPITLDGNHTSATESSSTGGSYINTDFLADGLGSTYASQIYLDMFGAGATVTAASDIASICLNIEHSFIGDLDIVVECPDGTTVPLVLHDSGQGAVFGEPIAVGLPIDDTNPAGTGVGYEYCWSPASVSGTVDNIGNQTTLNNYTDGLGNFSAGPFNQVNPGTYEIDGDWTDLIGCPLNGLWTMRVIDNFLADNGNIFGWSIDFDPSLATPWSFTPSVVSESWSGTDVIVTTNPGMALPTATGPYNFTYTVTDDFGCTYNEVVGVNVTVVANNQPCTATAIPVNGSCTMAYYDNYCATDSGIADPGCGNYNGQDVWFSLTVPPGGNLVLDSDIGVSGTPLFDMAMAAYSGPNCGSLTLLACDDNYSANGDMPSIVLTGQPVGSTIWVRMWDVDGDAQGDFGLCAWYNASVIYTCTGNFYDTGGSGGSYSSNENITTTYCPDQAGFSMILNFTFFNTETNYDYLYVYDGIDATAPNIGAYHGTGGSGLPLIGQVSPTPSNTTGCLTFVFASDGSVTRPGWAANISCAYPCQEVEIGSYNANPAFNTVGGIDYVDICQGEQITFSATGNYPENGLYYAQNDATSTFTWFLGDGNVQTGSSINYTYGAEGAYNVSLIIEDTYGCYSSEAIPVRVRISTTPDFSGTTVTPDPLCVGEELTLTGVVTPVQAVAPPGNMVSQLTSLPDGTGSTYTSVIFFDIFTPFSTLTNVNDILDVCLNIEHSYFGDLDIDLVCPDGSYVRLLASDGSAAGSPILGEPVASGLPIDNTVPPAAIPGIGYDYCWSPTSTNGDLEDAGNVTTIATYTDPIGQVSANVDQINPGTYEVEGNWADLLGCPLNGLWQIRITDIYANDNGYLFAWGMNFDPSLLDNWSFTPSIVSEIWTGNNVTTATNPGAATPLIDGNLSYTYSVTDDFGCTYDTVINVVVNPSPNATASNNGPYCPGDNIELFSGGGTSYTWSGPNAFASNQQNPVINNCTALNAGVYTVTVDDGSGCTASAQTTVEIDSQNPTASNPAPINVQCSSAVPAPNVNVVTDEADDVTVNPTVAWVSDVSDGNTCPEVITRTYSVTDDCGNSINVTQTITINDITNPTASNPAPINAQCSALVPAPDVTVVTDEADNCTVNPVVAFVSEVSDGNTCPETITRTYSVTDECGNSINVTQTITVDDNINPTASNPAATNVDCITAVPAVDVNVVTDEADNCTASPTVAFVSEVSNGATCPEVITRTYSVTDDCGNSINVFHQIIVNDNIDPTASNPAPINVECASAVPAADITVVTDEADNCTVNPVVAHINDVSDGNTCPEVISRRFSVTDDCGNSIVVTQTITINDITNPTASNPAPINVECAASVPAPDVTVVTDEADNCTVNPVVAFVSDVSDGNTCPEVITRTYSVTDACGNSINVTQIITIDDITNPTASNPAPINVECAASVPAPNIAVVTDEADNCTAAPVVAFVSDVSDGNTCPEVITRTYSVTDDCGNSINVTQTITIDDITNPTASNPAPINVECSGSVPAPDITVVTDEADNCTVNPVVAFVGDVTDGNTCPETITRTYSVTDECGNSINVTQTITVGDITDPTASNPAPINVECSASVPAPDVTVVTDEADNCTVKPSSCLCK